MEYTTQSALGAVVIDCVRSVMQNAPPILAIIRRLVLANPGRGNPEPARGARLKCQNRFENSRLQSTLGNPIL